MYENMDAHHFYGRHAERATKLKELGFFPRLVDILAVAPLLGFEYSRCADKDDENKLSSEMPLFQLTKVQAQCELNYKMIMLLDKAYTEDEELRFKKAFQIACDQRAEEDLERYESYVRGGIDLLYEKLVGSGNTQDERLMELYDFVESFSDRYYA